MSRVLIVIPARGGSRRVPGKNLRTVSGFPLVGRAAWIARAAVRSLPGGPHLVVCSTDDADIAATALEWGADRIVDRPPELATAKATTADAVLHAMGVAEASDGAFDAVVLLQPTAVLVEPSDLARAAQRFLAADGRSVVGAIATHPGWWHLEIDPETNVILDIPLPATTAEHHLSGAVYVVSPERFRADPRFVVRGTSLGFVLPAERSVDVDEAGDFVIAEAFASAQAIPPVPFGDRMLGDGSVLVIAEAGVNHDGDVATAHRLVDAAAATGADAVKFQTFDPVAIASSGAPTAAYQRAAGEGEDQQSMLARLALPGSAWAELQAHARERDLVFLSTPFDVASARPARRAGRAGVQGGLGRAHEPAVPARARRVRAADAHLHRDGEPARGRRGARCGRPGRRPAGRPVPLRVGVPGGATRMRTCGRSGRCAPRSACPWAGRTTPPGSSCPSARSRWAPR